MASTSSPYGIQAISDQTGFAPRTLRLPNGIASGLSSNIFKNQPVKMVAATGTLTPITATTDQIFGIFMGVEYTPSGGRPTESAYWPASTSYDSTQDMFAYVIPAWNNAIRFQVQADGAVAQALLGSGFNFSNFGNGSTSTQLSSCTVAAAGVAAGQQAQVTLVEFFPGVNSAIGDAYTDLIVSIAYPQVIAGYQTSIG